MTHEISEPAAAAIIEGERVAANLAELHGRLKPCFARVQPFGQTQKYLSGLMSDLPRKNGWTLAEHAGDLSPNKTQRLLNHAVWDQDAAMGVVRGFVAEHLAGQPLRVAALDESGQEKAGQATAGVKRQYRNIAVPAVASRSRICRCGSWRSISCNSARRCCWPGLMTSGGGC